MSDLLTDAFNTGYNWDGASCAGRPEEFCPGEDVMMTPEWTKETAPRVAQECLECPLFEQCDEYLTRELADPEAALSGILAGVMVVQKSRDQIMKALGKSRAKHVELGMPKVREDSKEEGKRPMIDWARKPYTKDQFILAWGKHSFVDDVAIELEVPTTAGSLRTLKRIGEDLNLRPHPIWGKTYSREEFTKIWNSSITTHEVAEKLGLKSTRGLKANAEALGLPSKDTKPAPYTTEEFKEAWENNATINEVALALGEADNRKSHANLNRIGKKLGYNEKQTTVYTTNTGEDASAIIADWIDWHTNEYKVQPTFVRQAAKKVRDFIIAGYSTASIKYGLYVWTVEWRKGRTFPAIMDEAVAKRHSEEHQEVAQNAEALEGMLNAEKKEQSTLRIERKAW